VCVFAIIKNMKKIVLSVIVVGAFVLYAVTQRHKISPQPVIVKEQSSGSPTIVNRAVSPAGSSSASNTPPTGIPLSSTGLKDGHYTGSAEQSIYGTVQVAVTIQNGKITSVQFLQYPNDRPESMQINTQAMPVLQQEAIAAQSASVDIVSGATDSSQSFRQSLQFALDQARG